MPGFEELWFNKRDVLQSEAEDTVSKALRKAGWKHTSQTPGSIWMWQRDIDGVLYSVSQSRAASIQENFDRSAYFKQYPDELGD
jgi:hypothetical protein